MTAPDSACVYLSVAANLAPEANILAAMARLGELVTLDAFSSFYRTPAIGRPEQPDYLNGVIRLFSPLAPRSLKMDVLRPIEAELGRVRTADTHAARPIDLDILVHGDHVVCTDLLTIPDPDIALRPFLGAALLELAPDIVLPGETRPLAEQFNTRELSALNVDRAFTRRLKERFTP